LKIFKVRLIINIFLFLIFLFNTLIILSFKYLRS